MPALLREGFRRPARRERSTRYRGRRRKASRSAESDGIRPEYGEGAGWEGPSRRGRGRVIHYPVIPDFGR